MKVAHLLEANRPSLCIDTCSLLDVVRDPTRTTANLGERRAMLRLIEASVSKQVNCLIAEQVHFEFLEHDHRIQHEASKNVEALVKQVMRVNEIASIYGGAGEIDLSHVGDHVTRARDHLQRWIETLHHIVPELETPARAFARMRFNRAPARRGKESSKDCLIFETYLGAGRALREAGMTAPIVFLSSNITEYQTESRVLKTEIAEDLDPLSMIYAPSAGAALRALGL